MRRRGCIGAAHFGALLITCPALDVRAQTLMEVSGELETSVLSRRLLSDDKHEVHAQALAHTHVAGYLWQPWIATVTADLDLAFEANPMGNYKEASSVAGNILLSGLPSSRYPFQIFFSAGDSRFDGDFSGADYTRMRAGVSGKAALGDRSTFDYLISHDQLDRSRYGDLSAQRAEAALRRNFDASEMPIGITDIGLSFNFYSTEFKAGLAGDPDYTSMSVAGTAYYRAEPAERLNHDFSGTVISDNFGNKQDRYDRIIGQGVGTAQWRSPSNDFAATSAVRMMVQQIDHRFAQKKTDTDSAILAASTGISWRASDQLTMTLGARANAEHTQTVVDDPAGVQPDAISSNYAGAVLSSIDYRSLSSEWSGFHWNWNARAAGDLDFNSNRYEALRYETIYGRRTDATVSLGHTLGKSIRLPWIEAVSLTLQQEIGFSHFSYDEVFKPVIMHSASLMKGVADEGGMSYFRVYLRDNHAFGVRPEEYQTLQVDYTRRVQLGGNDSLQGSLGMQVVHQQRDSRDEVYVFSRADLEYEHRDLFRIDGLSFLSSLRINALGQNDLVHDWRDELSPDLFRNDWRNRVQYRVGKLWLSLEGTLFQADQSLGHYVRFSGRRSFDFVD